MVVVGAPTAASPSAPPTDDGNRPASFAAAGWVSVAVAAAIFGHVRRIRARAADAAP